MNWPRFRFAWATRSTAKTTIEAPAQASGYEKIECIYQKMPGWQTSTEGITEYDKLPQAGARLPGISWRRKPDAKIGMISTGPDRDHTILMDEFVAELKTAAKKA